MADLHLLRPLWLLALPVGWALIWLWLGAGRRAQGGWGRVVDERLKPFVLSAPDALTTRRWPLAALIAAWTLAALALAGPSFERVEVPAFRSDDALVVALDLSRSMNAADVEPERLTRAKLKLMSLLERRQSGQTALVVFSAHAFTVTPLTSDTRTISSLVSSLSTDIMPSRGSYPEAGLTRAGKLLRQTGVTDGEVLLVTDAVPAPEAFDVARELAGDGFPVHVLAVGTEEGAPIADEEGGFVVDGSGDVVVPGVDFGALGRLAEAGGGRFARLAADDSDLERLFPRAGGPLGPRAARAGDGEENLGADIWRDEGVWLAVALLPLVALAFRRGWVAVLAFALVLPVQRADAFEWADLWKRPDQQGVEALEADEPAEAAAAFEDPEWRAVAQYRAGEFEASAATLTGLDSAQAHYNRGTAFAKAGRIQAAIDAYDRTLELDPEHADARHNRELLEEFLKQQQSQSDQQQQQSGNGEQGSEEQREGDSSGEQPRQAGGAESQGDRGSAADETFEQAGEPDGERSGEQQARQGEPSQDERAGEQQEPEGQRERGADAEGERLAAGPEDLEEWASDQAAEQWLRRVPQDPGGLLRRKFLYQYQRLGVDQEGNYVWPGDETEPW